MTRVLIVDDSAIVRKVLTDELSKYKDIEVIGTAVDPYVARDKIMRLNPDVITLDIEMPRMDGLTFLSKLMQMHPMPVVVLSSLTGKGTETAMKALQLGAVDVLSKATGACSTPETIRLLVEAIRAAASAKVVKRQIDSKTVEPVLLSQIRTTQQLIAIGASTGGTRALEDVMARMPESSPPVLIVQHIPPVMSRLFAERLNEVSPMEVREAQDGDLLANGLALVAPGGKHMVLQASGAQRTVRIKDGPPVHYVKPSVDVLFHSIAKQIGKNATAAILTGMGADGADGLLALRQAGAHTFAQDEATCVVFGMPKEAITKGAAEHVIPLHKMASALLNPDNMGVAA